MGCQHGKDSDLELRPVAAMPLGDQFTSRQKWVRLRHNT
jgi:hypothetical protein